MRMSDPLCLVQGVSGLLRVSRAWAIPGQSRATPGNRHRRRHRDGLSAGARRVALNRWLRRRDGAPR